MKTYKTILDILFSMALFATINQVNAQTSEVKEVTYQAYLNKNMDLWEKGLSMSTTFYENSPTDESLFELAIAQYGVLNATIIEKHEDIFDDHVDDAVENLEKLIDTNKRNGEPKAVLSSIYGVKMAYSPWKGIFLGGKSSNLMKDAIALSKESALVWKLYANSKLYTPQSFGGDKKEAAKGYEKAIALFEKDPASADKNWIYLDALAHLGITYMQLEKNDKARETFERALEVEPEFNWVKYILLPQLDKS